MLGQRIALAKKENFNPNRSAVIFPKAGFRGLKLSKYDERPKLGVIPKENVVCKCEKVTEYEVVDAIHRSLPIESTQAIRKRTRAGMGHWYLNFSPLLPFLFSHLSFPSVKATL